MVYKKNRITETMTDTETSDEDENSNLLNGRIDVRSRLERKATDLKQSKPIADGKQTMCKPNLPTSNDKQRGPKTVRLRDRIECAFCRFSRRVTNLASGLTVIFMLISLKLSIVTTTNPRNSPFAFDNFNQYQNDQSPLRLVDKQHHWSLVYFPQNCNHPQHINGPHYHRNEPPVVPEHYHFDVNHNHHPHRQNFHRHPDPGAGIQLRQQPVFETNRHLNQHHLHQQTFANQQQNRNQIQSPRIPLHQSPMINDAPNTAPRGFDQFTQQIQQQQIQLNENDENFEQRIIMTKNDQSSAFELFQRTQHPTPPKKQLVTTTTTTTTNTNNINNLNEQSNQRQRQNRNQFNFNDLRPRTRPQQIIDIDECLDSQSCGKGAICENLPGSFRCQCPPGFAGDPTVECIDMDECRHNPCGIGAQCTNIPGGYRCSCAPGFERNPTVPSSHFGVIQSGPSSQLSLAEMTNSSLIACMDINECLVAPGGGGGKPACGSGAQCINTQGGYFCQCPPGYNGNPKVACLDIDECASHVCGPNAQCKNAPGTFKCECKSGYTGNPYSPEGCQDEDECLRKDACGLNAQCFNTLGAYQCSCQSGYSGNPYTKCLDIDECSPTTPGAPSPCGPGAQCQNLEGGYRCTCPDKFQARGSPEMGCQRAAVDIDCDSDLDCTQNALCVNRTCHCKLGYQIKDIECVDVDECSVSHQQQQVTTVSTTPAAPIKAFTRLSSALHSAQSNASTSTTTTTTITTTTICGSEATCRNQEGSYECECRPGFEKIDPSSPHSKCRDIDECERSNPCGQNSKCFNTEGSFKCACNDGFIPIDFNPTNGCKSPCDGVNCGQHATCKPDGEEAACVCKPGFTFDPNNIKLGCVDINECDTKYSPSGSCGQRAICTNEPGSYRCSCPPGYSGDAYRYCEDINECDRKFGVFGQCGDLAICTNKPGSYSCACAPGYTGDPKSKCTDVDECSSKFGPNGKCGVDAICTNAPGRYSCKCPPGYSGDPNERCVPDQPACKTASDCGTNQVCQAGRCQCPFAQQAVGDGTPATTLECKHPCDKTECGEHATCQLDSDYQPLCVCDAGYMAPSDGRSGCVDVNECIQGVTLSGITPISALTQGGAIALGPSSATTLAPAQQALNMTGGHPCGRNALCRNQPGTFDCVCPPGYTGNAYESCNPEVRTSSQQTMTTSSTPSLSSVTTTTTTGNMFSSQQQQQQQQQQSTTSPGVFGNYQQEPRTTACNEQCPRGYVCSDGQCMRPDSCRANEDCRQSMACEHVNQLVGFQCVNVCELNVCGPEAKCTPSNHKAICSCNSTATGSPYDPAIGCRQQQQLELDITTTTKQAGTTTTATSGQTNPQFETQTTRQDQYGGPTPTTTASMETGGQSHSQGDISTVSFQQNEHQQQQQQVPIHTLTMSHNTSTTSMDQLMRQQVLDQQQQQQQQQQQANKRPNQPLIATYEAPLPTTPNLPHFDLGSTVPIFNQYNYTTTSTTTHSDTEQRQDFSTTSQQQQLQSLGQSTPSFQTTLATQAPPVTTTPTPTLATTKQATATTPTLTTQNLFTTKRKPIQVQQSDAMISSNQNQNNRQDDTNELIQKTDQRQDGQQTTTTSTTKSSQQQFTTSLEEQFASANKSSSHLVQYHHRQITCTNDQHCPGNLFCLGDSSSDGFKLSAGQKICGCPAGYKREADYCYLYRVNCTSAAVCKPREECIPQQILRQYYAASSPPYLQQQQQQQQSLTATTTTTTISQQFSLGNSASDELNLSLGAGSSSSSSGICICPRGYKLTASGIACIDRNECDEGTPCAVGAICQNKIGSYECVCPPGTVGEPYTKTCEPILRDECRSNSDCANDRECDLISRKCISPCHICGPRAICTATNHAAICLCPPRFTGNAIDQVYGCQEPPAPTTTTTSLPTTTTTLAPTTMTSVSSPTTTPTSISRQQTTTTAVGVPVTTLLPSTTVAPIESTTPELVEFRTIPPSELFVMCLADGIQVEVQLGGFDGIIYVKGHSQDPKCRKLVMSSSASEFVDFKVQFGHCDLIHRDGEAGFVLVIQKHPKLVTYRARAYHVKCVYNTGERTVTLGFNVSMITTSGTIANTGPPPTCLMSITALDGREVTSAEIGQDLLLRVDVQPDSIYGGFARSCEAKTMDDEGEYQYQVTDANGCATDPSIFSDWKYDQQRKSLVARFNAFKFPSSNNLRFQCNIRVCFGSCPAVNCNGIDAYGKRRRRREAPNTIGGSNSTRTLNNEDDDDDDTEANDELIVSDAFKEGALREEIMVQSNAILTFDKKEASLPQQQRPPVEDIEFVCLPRLGIVLSIALTTLLALLALAIATSCWCFAKKKRHHHHHHQTSQKGLGGGGGPLPHPMDFPNPLMRSNSASTLRESIYGP